MSGRNNDYKELLRSCVQDKDVYSSLEYLLEDEPSAGDSLYVERSYRDGENGDQCDHGGAKVEVNKKTSPGSDRFPSLHVTGTASTETASLSSDEEEHDAAEDEEEDDGNDGGSSSNSLSLSTSSSSSCSDVIRHRQSPRTPSESNQNPPLLPVALQSPLLTEWKTRYQRATQQRKRLSQKAQELQHSQQQHRLSTATTTNNPRTGAAGTPGATPAHSTTTISSPMSLLKRRTLPKTTTLTPAATTTNNNSSTSHKLVRFASQLITPASTARYLDYVTMTPPTTTTPSSTSLLLSPSPQLPIPSSSSPSLLLSPQQVSELQNRNAVLESAWIEQQESSKTLETKLDALQEQFNSQMTADTNTVESTALQALRFQWQLQHAQEVRLLQQYHKQQMEQLTNDQDQQVQQLRYELAALAEAAKATPIPPSTDPDTIVTLTETLAASRRHGYELEEHQSKLVQELERSVQEKRELKMQLEQLQVEQNDLWQLQLETAHEVKILTTENADLQEAIQVQAHQLHESQAQCEILMLREQEREQQMTVTSMSMIREAPIGEEQQQQQQSTLKYSSSLQEHSLQLEGPQLSSSTRNDDDYLDDTKLNLFQQVEQQMNNQMMNATLQMSELDSREFSTTSWSEAKSPSKLSMTVQALSPIWPQGNSPARGNDNREPDDNYDPNSQEPSSEEAQERTVLLDRFQQQQQQQSPTTHDSMVLRTEESNSVLDATMDLLHKMKDLITSPDGTATSPQETSLLEQLDILNHLMGFEDGSFLTLTMEDDVHQQELSRHSTRPPLHQDDDGATQKDPSKPWKELVLELRRQVAAIEHDRAELVRTTGDYWEEQHDMHRYEVEAASAKAFRQGYEEGLHVCPICQQKSLD